MINVLYISSFGSLRGGGQRSTYLMMKYLDKTKICPLLLVPEEGEFAVKAREIEVPVFVLELPRLRSLNICKLFKAINTLVQVVRENKIDIIHTESPRETIYASLVKFFARIKVFYHLRVTDSLGFFDRVIYYLVDKIIAVSNAAASRFTSFDKKNKVSVIYNSAELDKYKVEEKKDNRECLQIGYFGRIDRRKGIETLINAVNQIDGVKLLVMGSGDPEYTAELKEKADEKTEWLPYQASALDKMKEVDVIVLPSFYGEGLSRTIIEGLSLGKIVLVSDIAENVEAIGNEFKDLIFQKGNVSNLTATINKIISKDIDIDSQRLRKRAEDNFDIVTNTEKVQALYKEVLT